MNAPAREMVSAWTGMAGLVALLFLTGSVPARAQAVEVFTGNQAVSADVMFFNYFKDRAGEPSPVLLFHRSRALVDYDINTSSRTDLPQFGMTNAVSYNPRAWRGVAPVAAVSITTATVATKVGLQYARVRPTSTVFGWVVSEPHARPAVDVFFLGRCVRPITATVGLFAQLESINGLSTDVTAASSFTVRSRLGIDVARWQFGVGADVRHFTGAASTTTTNIGLFTRHAF